MTPKALRFVPGTRPDRFDKARAAGGEAVAVDGTMVDRPVLLCAQANLREVAA